MQLLVLIKMMLASLMRHAVSQMVRVIQGNRVDDGEDHHMRKGYVEDRVYDGVITRRTSAKPCIRYLSTM